LKIIKAGTHNELLHCPYEFEPNISRCTEKKRSAWIAKIEIPRIFNGGHFFELKHLDNGKTLLTNKGEYKEVLSRIFNSKQTV